MIAALNVTTHGGNGVNAHGAVGVKRFGRTHGIEVNGSADEARLNQDGPNAKLPNFMIERFRPGFEGMLRCGIDGLKGFGEKARYRTDGDHTARPPLAHGRQNGQGHAEDAKEVCFEEGLCLIDIGFFNGPFQRGTGIVDEEVDATGLAHYLGNESGDGSFGGYVEL